VFLSDGFTLPRPGLLQGWPLLRELKAVAAGRLCGPEEERRCRTASGAFAAWACAVCEEYLRPEALSPWTWHLLFLYRLRQAGYPFQANDLSLETWLLLGMLKGILENTQRGKYGQRQIHGI
jgi:hypothetical protein